MNKKDVMCKKCNVRLISSRYCINKSCMHFINKKERDEYKWNEWVINSIDQYYEPVRQVLKTDL